MAKKTRGAKRSTTRKRPTKRVAAAKGEAGGVGTGLGAGAAIAAATGKAGAFNPALNATGGKADATVLAARRPSASTAIQSTQGAVEPLKVSMGAISGVMADARLMPPRRRRLYAFAIRFERQNFESFA